MAQREEPRETAEDNDQLGDEGPELTAREEPRETAEDNDQLGDEGPELTSREEPSQQGDPQPPPEPEEDTQTLPEEPEGDEDVGEEPVPDAEAEGPHVTEPESSAPERPLPDNLPRVIRRNLPDLYNLVYVVTQDVAMADRLITDFGRGDPSVAYLPYDNVTVYSRYDRYRRPDGLTVGFYANDIPMSYVVYDRGDRQGTVRTWDPNGDLRYCGQYHRGDRRGFCCLFQEGELKLAVKYGSKEAEAVHLISGDRVLVSFAGKDQAKEDVRAAGPLEDLDGLEKELKANEIQFKKDLSEAVDKFRRGLAGELSQVKRRSIAQRANFRRAMTGAGARAVQRESTVPKTTRSILIRP